MIIKESSGYNNSKAKIKKNYDAKEKLSSVLSHVEGCNSFNDLKFNPISYTYGYEELRSDLSGYFRFGIDKNSKTGKLRLIFSVLDENIIRLEYITDEHYDDFKRYLREK